MVSRTHSVGALALLVTAGEYLQLENLAIITVVVALVVNEIGALLPDIDQASNRLWDLLPGGEILGKVFGKLFLGHRSLSHSFLGVFLVYRGSEWLIPKLFNNSFVDPAIIFGSLMVGYVSHLILDGLTEEGLPLLFPIKWKFGLPPIKKMRIKSGRWFENYVVFPLLLVYIGWRLVVLFSK
ncbi:hypothetical protein A3K55_01335 [Candidatus Shapirobacteria bacterium RBG_13_44_7]|uniref:Metal-dependent hydrolase n=1 Tax=Candidatus Shapirobacteria bacterium RBG_13_44_7 TaxID=1802149 RepID=A0A1F7SG73_9BACT|nr:MAG: hypothetical protein A3K55_01335 [Candidatus Shapirobacteria bacterium RBG_13_44_7]